MLFNNKQIEKSGTKTLAKFKYVVLDHLLIKH
jgi:hypothetical protein